MPACASSSRSIRRSPAPTPSPTRSSRSRYAAEPPATREVVVALPRIDFEAFIPDAAAALHPFVAAKQADDRAGDPAFVGAAQGRRFRHAHRHHQGGRHACDAAAADSISRRSTGLRVYPAQPSLEDKTDGRTDVLYVDAVDSATYMLERPGDYLLPAIDVRWWNVGASKVETRASRRRDAAGRGQSGGARRDSGRARPATRWDLDAICSIFVADHWLLALLAGDRARSAWLVCAACGASDRRLPSAAPRSLSAVRVLLLRPVAACGPQRRCKARRISRCLIGCSGSSRSRRRIPWRPSRPLREIPRSIARSARSSASCSLPISGATAGRTPIAAQRQRRAAPLAAGWRSRREIGLAATTQPGRRRLAVGLSPANAGEMKGDEGRSTRHRTCERSQRVIRKQGVSNE